MRAKYVWGSLSSILILLAASGSAWAQAADSEEIIVTAQKREQALNDVGMSINAITADTLSEQHIGSTADLSRIVPAFSVQPPNSSITGAPVYTLRGIGFNSRSLSAPQAVSIYADEMPLAFAYMSAGPLLDLQRVEVLKGPQGTLYGQNSTGGAINYIAAKPTDEFEFGADVSVGSFNEVDVGAFVSGPLAQNLRGRIAGRGIISDGWLESRTRPSDDFGDKDKQAIRAILDWDVTSSFRVQLTASGWRDRSDPVPFQVTGLAPSDPLGGGVSFPCFDGFGGCPALGGAPYPFRDELIAVLQGPRDEFATDRDVGRPYHTDNEFTQGSIRADWDINPALTLTSLTSYSRFSSEFFRDFDGTVYDINNFLGRGSIQSFYQELRLAGQGLGDRLTWIVGANYNDDSIRDSSDFEFPESSLGQALGIHDTLSHTAQERDGWAVFASADYELTPNLTLTGGVRHTEQSIDFNGCSSDPGDGSLAAVFAGTAGPGDCITYLDLSSTIPNQGEVFVNTTEDNVSWRVGLNWEPTDTLLLYGNVSRGFKSGDIPSITALLESQLQPVRQEQVTAYEIGIKAGLFNRRLQANAAVFYYDYVDKQLQTNVLTFLGLAEQTVNIPESQVQGAELELIWLPLDGLRISTGIGYTNSEVGAFQTFGSNPSPVWPPAPGYTTSPFIDVTGDPFNLAPKWQGNLDAQYEWTVGAHRQAFVGGSVAYADSTLPQLGASEVLRLEAHTTLDLRIGLSDEDGRWRATLWGRNVTDEIYSVGSAYSFDTSGRFLAMPATYGITLSLRP